MCELKFLLALFILANGQVDMFPFTVEHSTGNSYVCISLYTYVHDVHIFFDKHYAVTVENKHTATAGHVWWKMVVLILSHTAVIVLLNGRADLAAGYHLRSICIYSS